VPNGPDTQNVATFVEVHEQAKLPIADFLVVLTYNAFQVALHVVPDFLVDLQEQSTRNGFWQLAQKSACFRIPLNLAPREPNSARISS